MAHANSDVFVITKPSELREAPAERRAPPSLFAQPETEDARLTRQARRQALGLMVLSAAVSVAVICAIWLGLHAVL
ncbi:MAG: hypothetical protein ACREFY_03810 [Acetobacteraceae bacterium]